MFLYKIRASLPVSGLLAITCILGVVFGGQIGHLIAISYLVFYVAFAGLRLYKFTNRFGDISYGVYIYGFPVQQTLVFAVSNELTPATLTISALLITYVIGFASWWLFEEPALSLKDRLL
jgi:peptidoglycan/LPS O-acetylase OafA/YrhL